AHVHALDQRMHAIAARLADRARGSRIELDTIRERVAAFAELSPGWRERVAPFLRAHWHHGLRTPACTQAVAWVLAATLAGAKEAMSAARRSIRPPEDASSPFAPLAELWSLGVWPLALPGGDAIMWVPPLDARGLPELNLEQADLPVGGTVETIAGPHFAI